MNWLIELIATITLTAQMATLYYSWHSQLISSENVPLYLSIVILVLGVTSGLLTHFLKHKSTKERPYVKNISIITGAAVGGVGVFFVFIPFFSIVYHSVPALFMLSFGIFAPWALPVILKRHGYNAPNKSLNNGRS